MDIEEPDESSRILLNEQSLPLDIQVDLQEASAKMSLLNMTANSDDTLTERRGELQNVPQAACSSMPDLSRVASNRTLNRSGRTTPVRPMSLREYDEQLSELRKENFNLKLRIYFLESKLPKIKSLAGEDVIKLNLDLQVTVEKQYRELENKTDLLKGAVENITAIQKRYETEIMELKKDRQFMEKQLEKQILAKNEAFQKLQAQCHQVHSQLAEREKEVEQLREALVETEERVSHSLGPARENESDSEGLSSISLLDDKERKILDLQEMVADRENQLRLKNKQLENFRAQEHAESNGNDSIFNQSNSRTPRATEQTGIEAGSLIVAPETEQLISSMEIQLQKKESELDETRHRLKHTGMELAKITEEHENCREKFRQLEADLQASAEDNVKRDKTIQGLVKLLEKERKRAGQASSVGTTTLMARANAEISDGSVRNTASTPRKSEKFAQTATPTPDLVPVSDTSQRRLQIMADGGSNGASSPASSPGAVDVKSSGSQVMEGLNRATPHELRNILNRIQEFMAKQNGMVPGTPVVRFGVERSVGTDDDSPQVKEMEIGGDGRCDENYAEIADVNQLITVEDRVQVTEFVRVVCSSSTEYKDGASANQEGVTPNHEAETANLQEGVQLGLSPMEASWMFCETLAEMTSATELLNRTTLTTEDMGRLKRRLLDLRKICDRLYNKLRGSFKFLKRLLEQLGGAELARQFEDEFGALQFELEESMNATNAIFEEVKTAEISISGFVSELHSVSRRLSETPKTTDLNRSRFSVSMRQMVDSPAIIKSTAESGSNTELTQYQMESLCQTLSENQDLRSKNSNLHKTLDMLKQQLGSAQESLNVMKADYVTSMKHLEKLREQQKQRETRKVLVKHIGVGTEVTTEEWERTERRCAKYETYATAIKERLDKLERDFGLELGGSPCSENNSGSPVRSGRYFHKILDRLERILTEKITETDRLREAVGVSRRDGEDLRRRMEEIKKENERAQESLGHAKEKYETTVDQLNSLTLEYETLRNGPERRSVFSETEWTTQDLEKVEWTLRRYEQHFKSVGDAMNSMESTVGIQQATGSPVNDKDVGMRINRIAEKIKERQIEEREQSQVLRKDLERKVKATESSNLLLKEASQKAQNSCVAVRNQLDKLQTEYAQLAARKAASDGATETELTVADIEKMEKYIQMMKERVGKFTEDVGIEMEPNNGGVQGSPTRSRKMDKIFDYVTQCILSEREENRKRVEVLQRECEHLESGQQSKNASLEGIIRQLNENNAKLETRLREAADSIRNAKENVPPADPGQNYDALLKEIEMLKQENNRLQERLMKTMEMLTNTQERLTAKTSSNEEAKDGIVRELAKIGLVLKQSRQDLITQQRQKAGRKMQEKAPRN